MDISPVALVGTVTPHLPAIIATLILAVFGLSRNASVQEFLTEIIVTAARPVLGKPAPLLQSQRQFCREFGLGLAWIAKYTIPKIEEAEKVTQKISVGDRKRKIHGVQEALAAAISALGDGNDAYTMPRMKDLYVEWTGHRNGVSAWARRPDLPEQEQYKRLMQGIRSDGPTLLFFHGGAFWSASSELIRSTADVQCH